MSSPDTNDQNAEGRFSLKGLSAAFARLTGSEETEQAPSEIADALDELDGGSTQGQEFSEVISPRMIVEGMLFVGKESGGALTNREMAANIRDVSPKEIDRIILEINELYLEENVPYEIVSIGSGYQMQIRPEFDSIRQRFYGRVREAKLTPSAIEVLSIVAYRQPVSADDVTKLRGSTSRGLLNQLVRRGLLSIERNESAAKKTSYFTTDRFNRLFQINSPQDLPRSEDLDDN